MSSIDQQFVEYIVKSLVGNPDAVSIERRIDEKGVLLELTVDPEDLGRVIGKRGATAQSLRTLLRALGTKNDARYNLKIVDNDMPADPTPPAPVSGTTDDSSSAVADDSQTDDASTSNDATEQPVEETTPVTEDNSNNRLQNTRKELADLDDLDI